MAEMTAYSDGAKLQVLLVEDSETSAMLVIHDLATAVGDSFVVTRVETLAAALERLKDGNVDVVLLDLWLPDANGIESFLKVHRQSPEVPVVVMCGGSDQTLVLQALQEGAQDYLVKGQGDGVLLAWMLRHVVERHRLRLEIAEERVFLRSVLDSLPDEIYVKDLASRFVVANKETAKSFGVAPDALIGKSDFDFFPYEVAASFRSEETAVMETQTPMLNREAEMTDHSRRKYWVLTTKVPLRDLQGRVIGLVGINRDISDRKKAEEELEDLNFDLARSQNELLTVLEDLKKSHKDLKTMQMQLIDAEKLESVGRMAAGVAHEVKNPLAIILMGIECLAAEPCAEDALVKSVLDDMRSAVNRGDAIVRGLLDFSRVRRLDLEENSLNGIIEKSLLLVKHDCLKNNITVIKHLAESLPAVMADRIKMEQVFVNVFTNAIHAMPAGGTLTVTTRTRSADDVRHDPGQRDADRLREGEMVLEADVDDTGHGIPAEKVENVFDPFFTTKATGAGTGLGLTVVKKIVELHRGRIRIANRPEGGVRVSVLLRAAAVLPEEGTGSV